MNILVMYQYVEGKAPKPIMDVQVVPKNELKKYAQRAAELNKDKTTTRRLYVIEEVPDNSLTAFVATDRHYDMNKYEELAKTLFAQIDKLRDDVKLLFSQYVEATEYQAAHPKEQPHDGDGA